MKKLTIIIALVITSLSGNAVFAKEKGKDNSVVVLSGKHNAFHFKVENSFKGGVVEVYNANETLLGYEELVEKEMLIDFSDLPAGNYIIKVKNGDKVEQFSYQRR